MYKIAVPVTNGLIGRMGREKVLAELTRAGAERVFLASGVRGIESDETRRQELAAFRENRAYFERAGLEVGAWICSLGHGGALAHEHAVDRKTSYTRITGFHGETRDDTFCPLDADFAADYCAWVRDVASTGVRMIMLDDDFRLSFRGYIGCCCDLHLREYQKAVGEKITRGELAEKIFCGGENRYRDAWLDLSGKTLSDFARQIRAAVESVDPSIRVGLCASPSTWDTDGVSSITLTKLLAGETKPFLRLIGAPYWAASRNTGNRLANVIELERMQRHWCENAGVELFPEGDVYPRPRFNVPAVWLEAFDTALRADGGFDGILKYMLDYVSGPRYETGYIDAHEKSRAFAAQLGDMFRGKKSAGVNVADPMLTLRRACLPEGKYAGDAYVSNRIYPTASCFLCDASLPMTYGGQGCATVAFGESAQTLGESGLKNGVILDVPGARSLMARGVDIGVAAIAECSPPYAEYFPAEEEYVCLGGGRFYSIEPKAGAKTLTKLLIGKDGETAGAVAYENGAGCRFLIYPFDAYESRDCGGLFRSYCRQRQLAKTVAWLQRRPLEAVCPGHPDLYLLCAESAFGASLAVGLWNFSDDPVCGAEIRLGGSFREVRFLGCRGRLESDRVTLTTELPAYGCAAFEVS